MSTRLVITGFAGRGLNVTFFGADEPVQLFASVTVTVNVPFVRTVMLSDVSPDDHA